VTRTRKFSGVSSPVNEEDRLRVLRWSAIPDLNDSHPPCGPNDVRVAWYPNPCRPLGGFCKMFCLCAECRVRGVAFAQQDASAQHLQVCK